MINDPGGASLFWTSEDPAVVAARYEVLAGRLSAAESRLRGRSDAAAHEGMQILGWIRRDYGMTAEQALAKIRESIPDLTTTDVERWRSQGLLQHSVLDGVVGFLRSEPANLFRFCPEAIQRRVPVPAASGWILEDHVERVIGEVIVRDRPLVVPIRHEVDYELTVHAGTSGLVPGAVVRAWLPFPQAYRQQQDVRLVTSSPSIAFIAPEGSPQRTIYFEHRVRSADEPVKFSATIAFTTSAYCPLLAGTSAPQEQYSPADLAERAPHLVFTPALRSAVADAVGGELLPLERARRIFHWVDGNIAYNAEEEYGIVPSLSERALVRRRGDCGVQGMLFIAMCRCAGIPARWQSGWQTQRARWNMHDWCEFFVEPFGWLPADPSYGLRTSDDPRVREFFFGNMDAYRLIVNCDYGRSLVPTKLSLRSEPLDFQRGEVEIDGMNLYFDQWLWKFTPRWLAQGS